MSTSSHKDPTFIRYTPEQAKDYAQHRSGYAPRLIQHILTHHGHTGGRFGTVLDVGCGPGNSTRDLAPFFSRATGVDPSTEMTNAAKKVGGTTKDGNPIEYLTSDAEVCDGVDGSSVDLLTAAMSAHWFDMKRFWPTAARVLKPGGTVALFNVYRMYCPPSQPEHEVIQGILLKLDFETLDPFLMPGNREVMNGYKGLEMPWTFDQSSVDFVRQSYVRSVWNGEGRPEPDGSYMCGEKTQSIDDAQRSVATSSSVTRWREAYPRLAYTEQDCVVSAFAEISKVLGPASKFLTTVGPTVLLMLKRR